MNDHPPVPDHEDTEPVSASAENDGDKGHSALDQPSEPDQRDAARSAGASSRPTRRQITVSMRSLSTAIALIAVATLAAVFIYRDHDARQSLAHERGSDADRARAEAVAGSYATGAATLDYRDLSPWVAAVKKGVSPDLQKKYDVVGQAMEQIMVPLRMQMTSDLVTAKTTDVVGDIYRVQAVVNTTIKSEQAPDGASSTAVYSLTMNKSKNWEIETVGDPTQAITNSLEKPGPPGVFDKQPADSAPVTSNDSSSQSPTDQPAG